MTLAERQGAAKQEIADARVDIVTGMLFSNLIMFFVILTTGATLHVHGQTQISTVQQAANALRPLAGNVTYLLFTLGIIGTGMLSVPVLAGSTAYAIAEGANWRHSLRYRPRGAPEFYAVLMAALVGGLALNYVGFQVVAMLFWSAVVNGVLATPLIVLVVLLAMRTDVMGRHVPGPVLRVLGWAAAAVMTAGTVAMLLT